MNYITQKLILSILAFAIGFSGCSQLTDKTDDGEKSKGTLSRELTAQEKQIAEADKSFSYEIFRQTIESDDSENVFISPLSVSMALGMTLNGAEGETEQAMKEVLHLQDMDMPDINESYASLTKLLTEADPRVDMKMANSIWIREGFPVEEEFKENCREFFEARIESLDFSDPSAPDIINQWVSDNTEQFIEEIIEGSIPADVIMYLINAIYFKGDWQYQFDPEETDSKPFTLEDGTPTETDMMMQENDLAAHLSDEVQLLDLPYGDSLFTMTLMMPGDEQQSIDDFIQNDLNAENMDRWLSEMSVTETNIELPKFELEYEIMMTDILKIMGMEHAFIPNEADFSGINPDEELFIDKVKHKSFVTVDEEGTEAAAVTSVSVGVTSAGPQTRTLKFNRPFVFTIRERTSGTILFMGVMKNPSGN